MFNLRILSCSGARAPRTQLQQTLCFATKLCNRLMQLENGGCKQSQKQPMKRIFKLVLRNICLIGGLRYHSMKARITVQAVERMRIVVPGSWTATRSKWESFQTREYRLVEVLHRRGLTTNVASSAWFLILQWPTALL